MANGKVIVDLCSSDEEEEDLGDCEIIDEEDLEETEEEEEDDDSSFSENDDDSDWRHDDDATESDVEVDEDDETREKGNDGDDDDKVTRLLTAGSDLKALNLKECKAYLRKHGLRLSGTKAVCIERIVEHWRIKDGSGEATYPRSSFTINCKGDVCKGDTVLFTQKVPQKSGKIMGRRTVAGSVVKESYGTAKQQHTFTIEVLWCEGIQKLPPLYPLLVKGRNLYRLMTLRQRWANEVERVKVLSEKHGRGAAARNVMRERKIKLGYVFKDGRLQKPGLVKKKKKPCQVKTRKTKNKEPNHSSVAFPNQNPSQGRKNPTQCRNMNQPSHSYAPPRPLAPLPLNVPRPNIPPPHSFAYSTQQNQTNQRPPQTVSNGSHLRRPNVPPSHSYSYPVQQNQSNQRPPQGFYNRRPTFNAPQGQAFFNPHARPVTYQWRPYLNHHHTHHGGRDLDHFSDMMISHGREGNTYMQSEDIHRPYKNHYSARDLGMVSHRTERDAYGPNHRP